jgi:hypothetical protein
LYATAMADC